MAKRIPQFVAGSCIPQPCLMHLRPLQRARLAMQDDRKGGKLSGEIEVDESYIGGKARNMHRSKKVKKLQGKGGGYSHKIAVQGILERGGEIRAHVIDNSRIGNVVPNVEAS